MMRPHRLRLHCLLKSLHLADLCLKLFYSSPTFQLDPISGAPEATVALMKTALTVVETIRAVIFPVYRITFFSRPPGIWRGQGP